MTLGEKQANFEKRHAQLEAKKIQLINQNMVRTEKEEMRLRILIGTGILDDLKDTIEIDTNAYSNKMKELKSILDRTIKNKSQRDFLKQYGFI